MLLEDYIILLDGSGEGGCQYRIGKDFNFGLPL